MKNQKLNLNDFVAVDTAELIRVKGGRGRHWRTKQPPGFFQPQDGGGGGGGGCGPGLPGGITQVMANIENGVKSFFSGAFGNSTSTSTPNPNFSVDHQNGCPQCPPIGTGPGLTDTQGYNSYRLGTALTHFIDNHSATNSTFLKENSGGNCN